MPDLRVLLVASECAPFIKTGGLADVVGALPAALAPEGVEAVVMLPAYRSLLPMLKAGKEVAAFKDLPGGEGRLVQVVAEGVTLLLLDAPQHFDRAGGPYLDENGQDWPDNVLRFGALADAAARVAEGAVKGFVPDILHAHDWQAGLAPVYLRQRAKKNTASVTTIHNIAFQGRFGVSTMKPLGLNRELYHPEFVEYHGDVSFLKAGLVFSDRITTVSPTYAREILTPEFGMGLEGLLQARQGVLSGLLNGIDLDAWNPATDQALVSTYDARSLMKKYENRPAVASELGLDPKSKGPLFCVVSRLSEQKGLDALLGAVPHLVARGAQLAVLGTGAPELEAGFKAAAEAHPGRVGAYIGYDEAFSHLLQGASDAILIPSRFEPCGLTQLYGLRYGTLPVVARTGGLADTVIDANAAALDIGVATGFVFDGVHSEAIKGAIDRVVLAHANRRQWRAMQRAAMRQPVGWGQSAKGYAELYRDIAR